GGAFLGIWKTVAEINEEIAADQARQAKQAEALKAFKEIQSTGDKFEFEVNTRVMEPSSSEIQRINKEREEAMKKIEEAQHAATAMTGTMEDEAADRARVWVERYYDGRIAEIRRKSAEERQAAREEQQRLIESLDN